MKTDKLTSILVALFAIFAMTSAKAQCTQTIQNALNCSIDVQVQVYNNTMCNGTPCNTYTQTIPNNTTVSVVCGSCTTPGCVRVTVTDAGAGPVSASTNNSTFIPANFAADVSCGTGTQGTISFNLGTNQFIVN